MGSLYAFPAPSFLPTIHHLIHSWPEGWPLKHSFFPPQPDALILAIQEGHAIAVCDGSYMPTLAPDLGAASWWVEDPLSQQAMHGTVQTSGLEADVDSYRSELQGVHATLLALLAFCT